MWWLNALALADTIKVFLLASGAIIWLVSLALYKEYRLTAVCLTTLGTVLIILSVNVDRTKLAMATTIFPIVQGNVVEKAIIAYDKVWKY